LLVDDGYRDTKIKQRESCGSRRGWTAAAGQKRRWARCCQGCRWSSGFSSDRFSSASAGYTCAARVRGTPSGSPGCPLDTEASGREGPVSTRCGPRRPRPRRRGAARAVPAGPAAPGTAAAAAPGPARPADLPVRLAWGARGPTAA